MRRLALLTLPLFACATGAATPDPVTPRDAKDAAGLSRELAGLVPGKPVDCLPTQRQAHTRGYGATIVYVVSSRLKYRSDTAGGCEGLRHGDYFVTSTPIGRTCRGDIAQTFDTASRVPTGSCSFGDFVPYRRP